MFVIFPQIEGFLTPFWENLLDPLILVAFTSPIISYWIILPYARQRDAAEKSLEIMKEEAKIAHAKKEDILLNQAQELTVAVKEATKQINAAKERYEYAAKATNEGLWDWNIGQNSIYYSNRFKEMLGLEAQEFPENSESWLNRIHPNDKDRVLNLIEDSKKSQENTNFECDYQLNHHDGHYIWVKTRWIVLTEQNKNIRLVGSQADITQRKLLETQLMHDALHDGLTGLPNRTLLRDRLNYALETYSRNPSQRFALVFLDVDNFKRLNDTLGHSVGDNILIKVAHRIRRTLRKIDTAARLGGDEFAILIPNFKAKKDIEVLLTRLLAAVNKPILFEDKEIFIKISAGVVISDVIHKSTTHEKIIVDADLALYHTKENAKGSYSFFDPSMRNKYIRNFNTENDLARALMNKEITTFYQPIVDSMTSRIIGFEALMRWKHPDNGWISPSYFVPLAENSEIIHELGNYVLEQAVEQIKKWNTIFKRDDWFMSINVSGRQFDKKDFVGFIKKTLKKHKIAPTQIHIEVTESILIEGSEKVKICLNEIKDFGIHLAIDDFGTGYSSLSTIYEYTFDIIKIDKSFIDKLNLKSTSTNMVNMIQKLAESMGAKTIAEGVESYHQLETLKDLGCNYIQGYYFCKPHSSDEITSFLESGMRPQEWIPHEKSVKEA